PASERRVEEASLPFGSGIQGAQNHHDVTGRFTETIPLPCARHVPQQSHRHRLEKARGKTCPRSRPAVTGCLLSPSSTKVSSMSLSPRIVSSLQGWSSVARWTFFGTLGCVGIALSFNA